jgi:hypothetical protein
MHEDCELANEVSSSVNQLRRGVQVRNDDPLSAQVGANRMWGSVNLTKNLQGAAQEVRGQRAE